jgi:hypothetical protein
MDGKFNMFQTNKGFNITPPESTTKAFQSPIEAYQELLKSKKPIEDSENQQIHPIRKKRARDSEELRKLFP